MRIGSRWGRGRLVALVALGLLVGVGWAPRDDQPVTFTGGHEIGKADHGRPCVLIAAGLGVETDVFRKAFSGVTPAKGRGPSGAEARQNKVALLRVLGPHGVTNERLDEVSNYYRFRPQDDEIWTHKAARAHAVVANGRAVKVVVTEPGSGYTTPPRLSIPGVEPAEFVVKLHFDKRLDRNGSIESIEVKPAGTPPE